MTRTNGTRRSSIRARLTRQFVAAILGLLMSFAAVTLAAIAVHLYRDAEFDTRMILGNLTSQQTESIEVVLDAYSRSTDPRIWVVRGARVIDGSPNALGTPPKLPYTGLLWNPVSYQLTRTVKHTTFVIDWPLSSDAALLRELSLVVLFVTLAGMGAGVATARWTTRRALVPLKSLTSGVRSMLDAGRIMPIPMSSGRDEFYDLAGLLNRLLSDLEERRQRDQALLADATHHLRTPMAVIRGNLDLVKAGEQIDRTVREESLAAIDRTVLDMSRLVDDLLTMEHAHNLPPRLLMPLDLLTLAKEVYDDARAIAGERINLAFDEHIAGGTWVYTKAARTFPTLVNPFLSKARIWLGENAEARAPTGVSRIRAACSVDDYGKCSQIQRSRQGSNRHGVALGCAKRVRGDFGAKQRKGHPRLRNAVGFRPVLPGGGGPCRGRGYGTGALFGAVIDARPAWDHRHDFCGRDDRGYLVVSTTILPRVGPYLPSNLIKRQHNVYQILRHFLNRLVTIMRNGGMCTERRLVLGEVVLREERGNEFCWKSGVNKQGPAFQSVQGDL
ncbi:HAMP domain-containing histidine kinase [Sulfobacillus sp. DSM 109850]|uniref:histidine kinase n=1 Tax=Sulfobacillus harzensis TaxID=2729629 RepID=A0A7Y0Q336_9FIRM|nr:HAMP domain-containing sensor histidine kinase [Sulfobacillus harzensis]NMP23177.1 HAMP domain-containing histidine kinase [Sulfobacillus harzensis]